MGGRGNASLLLIFGTRPSQKNRKEGLVNGAGWKCTLRNVRNHIAIRVSAKPDTRRSVLSCLVLTAFKNKTKHEDGLAFLINAHWNTNQSQSEMHLHTRRSVHFHPSPFTRPSFSIFRGSGSETTEEVADSKLSSIKFVQPYIHAVWSYGSVWNLPESNNEGDGWVILHQLWLPLILHGAMVLL